MLKLARDLEILLMMILTGGAIPGLLLQGISGQAATQTNPTNALGKTVNPFDPFGLFDTQEDPSSPEEGTLPINTQFAAPGASTDAADIIELSQTADFVGDTADMVGKAGDIVSPEATDAGFGEVSVSG